MGRRPKIAIVCNLDHMASPAERLASEVYDQEWADTDILILKAAIRHGWNIDSLTRPVEYLMDLGEDVVRGTRKIHDDD